MSLFPPHFLDVLQERASLVHTVNTYTRLKRQGKEFRGLCPFHQERTPSFWVNEHKGLYYCFGCGKAGNVFDFVMEKENLTFEEAVRMLAGRVGLELPELSKEAEAAYAHQKTLQGVTEFACQWFEKQLYSLSGAEALLYLRERGMNETALRTFRIGYAPNQWEGLKRAALEAGFEESLLLEAGLLIPREQRSYDRFRHRVIFPIMDPLGKVIAFGGRVLGKADPDQPKYINSPETALFRKSEVLYGYHSVRRQIRKDESVVLVEGYMDVISLHCAGYPFAMAPMGTALTAHHLAHTWRLAKEPILCFDGDTAGQNAMARALDIALPLLVPGKSLKICRLPAGQDPDDIVRRDGIVAIQNLLQTAKPLSEVIWELEYQRKIPTTPEDKAALQRRLYARVKEIEHGEVQHYFHQYYKEKLYALSRTTTSPSGATWKRSGPAVELKVPLQHTARFYVDTYHAYECACFSILLRYPTLLYQTEVHDRLVEATYLDQRLDRLRNALLEATTRFSALTPAALEQYLQTTSLMEEVHYIYQIGGTEHGLPITELSAALVYGYMVGMMELAHLKAEQSKYDHTHATDEDFIRLMHLKQAIYTLEHQQQSLKRAIEDVV